ncbi:MAG: hypothetical protein FJ004_08330 [Chloroflexi bacterium]|nr:hypothetical protein [Chloroflexota bacterium]
MIKFPNMIKLLVVLAMVCSLVAIAAAPASAAADAVLVPATGPVGQAVTIQASGYLQNQVLTAKFDGSAMNTSPSVVTVPAGGAINFTVTIPVTTAGEHTISVYTDGINPINKTFTVTPKVSISPTSGPVGTSVTVTGTGFSGDGVTVSATLGGAALFAGVLVAGTGSFTATGTVPSTLGAGGQALYAIDGAGKDVTKADAFSVTPTLVITPSSGLAGSKVTITGKGWPAGTVGVKFAGQNWIVDPPGLTVVDGQITGGANKQIPVNYAAGTYSVVATSGATQATATFVINARPLTLTPSSGPRGTSVLITGSQMTPSTALPLNSVIDDNFLDLTFGGLEWNPTTEITIDSSGVISPVTRVVPAAAALGANIVYAWDNGADFNDATANDNLVAQGTFTVAAPTLSVSPTTGPKGSAVVFTGSGWLPGAAVTITLAGSVVTSVPDGNGNIAATMAVPAAAAVGANQITANDGATGNAATPVTFTVPGAAITVSPTEGAAGTSVTVTGSGFAAYTAITMKIGTYTYMTQPLSDALGAFSGTITVPGLAPGAQSITASDGPNTVSAFFVIKTAPPTVASALASISSKLVRVWGYSGGTWSMYDPADAAGSNLTALTAGQGYWINVSEAVTLIYGGYSYALSAGWNLIGWR